MRIRVKRLLPILLVILGALAMCYPVVATWARNSVQTRVAQAYRESTSAVSPEERNHYLEEARRYNEENAGGPILDPWLARVAKDNRPYQNYLEMLNPTRSETPMAVLAIPSIKSTLPIYHGTEPETLEHGVGHLYGSALPVGGQGMHSILTGHTGLVQATLFDDLNKVKLGDTFFISVMGETLTYQVDQIEVVLPDQISQTAPIPDRDLVTLVTCTPYGVNSHRLLVRGSRIPTPPEQVDQAFKAGETSIWQSWMYGALAVVAILLLLWLLLLAAGRKRKKESETSAGGRHRGGEGGTTVEGLVNA